LEVEHLLYKHETKFKPQSHQKNPTTTKGVVIQAKACISKHAEPKKQTQEHPTK
jgi:hypothetical protein